MGRAGANHARPHRMRHVRLHRTNQLFLSKTVHDILLYFCQLEKSNFIWSTILSYPTPTEQDLSTDQLSTVCALLTGSLQEKLVPACVVNVIRAKALLGSVLYVED